MLTTASFVLVSAVLLIGIGRTVSLPGPPPDVEPRAARDVAVGLLVLWRVGAAYSERIDHYTAELSGAAKLRRQPS